MDHQSLNKTAYIQFHDIRQKLWMKITLTKIIIKKKPTWHNDAEDVIFAILASLATDAAP